MTSNDLGGASNKYTVEPQGFRQFEFALTDALILQLVECLDCLEPAILDSKHVSKIPNGQGVYQLYLDDRLEYVGKTDTDSGLTSRLSKHADKINSRPSLRCRVKFKAVQVLVFSAIELETLLIRHYKSKKASMNWQHSGFGSNDPGRRRDHTNYKEDHFDNKYPIDISEHFDQPIIIETGSTIREAMETIKSNLNYNFRYERSPELDLTLPKSIEILAADNGLEQLLSFLPKGWQATNLPGYLILYKESSDYIHGKVVARS